MTSEDDNSNNEGINGGANTDPLLERMQDAVFDLRSDVSQLDVPSFQRQRQPVPWLAAAAILAVVVIGAVALLRTTDTTKSVVTAAPPPVETDVELTTLPSAPEPSVPEPSVPEPSVPEPSVPEPETLERPEAEATVERNAVEPKVGPLTSNADGVITVPSPLTSAWNADESRLLLYRTRSPNGGHVIFDITTGAEIRVLDIDPPDIEQVYWSPTDPSIVHVLEADDMVAVNVESGERSVVHTFDACDRVDSGPVPVAPSQTGTFGLLCHNSDGITAMSFNVVDGTEKRVPSQSEEAPNPSLSGAFFASWNSDGSVAILDDELEPTGVVLDMMNNSFVFARDGAGNEIAISAQFDGDWIGSVVAMPLDGSEPSVIVGPDTGFEYPPTGTQLSAATSSPRVSFTTSGDSGGPGLAGTVVAVDLDSGESQSYGPHGSSGAFDYWSSPFISMSPTGRYLVFSSDDGGDAVNTNVVRVVIPDS